MYNLQYERYEMLQRTYSFVTNHADLFSERTLARELNTRIGNVLEELKRLSGTQMARINSAMSNTEQKTHARAALRQYLIIMAQTARLIARTIPRFDEQFPVQQGRGDASLLYRARVFAEQAAPHSDVFIRYALAPNFIEELNTHIQNVEHAIRNRSGARTAHKDATAGIEAAIKKGMDAITQLDVIAANTLRGKPDLLAAWKSARHVKHARRKKAASADNKTDSSTKGGEINFVNEPEGI
jgi:hypothetical protein